jgi:hypothetical protein
MAKAEGPPSSQRSPDPFWCLAKIQHAPDYDDLNRFHAIVYGIWKTPRQKSVKGKHFSVNASKQNQRIDLRKQTIEKIGTESLSLPIVKHPATVEIVQR